MDWPPVWVWCGLSMWGLMTWAHGGDLVRTCTSHHLATWPCDVVWGHGLMAASPCSAGLLRFLSLTFFLITLWIFSHSYTSFSLKNIRLPRWLGEYSSLLETGPMDQG